MTVRITAETSGSLAEVVRNLGKAVASDVEAGLSGLRAGLVADLRNEISAAFPNSRRLPTTITATYYPARDDGREPAVWVYPRRGSNAGKILGGHRGAEIRPLWGKMLAVPTPDGLRLMRGRRLSPAAALAALREGRVGRGGRRRVVIDRTIELEVIPLQTGGRARAAIIARGVTYGQSGRVRAATKGRAARGMVERPIVLFWLVPSVRLPPRLRPDEIISRWVDLMPDLIARAAAVRTAAEWSSLSNGGRTGR